jgi:hypothetical protein
MVSTPGRRKALRALAKRKRLNKARMKQGKKPIVKGKKVSPSTLRRKKRRR